MASFIRQNTIESLEGFQNLDKDQGWLNHAPRFAWTEEDLREFEEEERLAEIEQLALANWWEMEGVRCATFGNPNKNPYL
jgi:hypothetical protein